MGGVESRDEVFVCEAEGLGGCRHRSYNIMCFGKHRRARSKNNKLHIYD